MTSRPCPPSASRRAAPSARARARAAARRASAPPSALAAALLASVGLAVGCGDDGRGSPAPPALSQDRFDSAAAFDLIESQVDYGIRPAGSEALRLLADELRPMLPNGRFEAVPGGLRNVVGAIPGSRPAILVAAHYDTEHQPPGFVGANDGAAGTAAVVQLAETLERELAGTRHREVRFALFDGEEEPPGCPNAAIAECGLRGSKAFAAAHPGEIGELILLDYIANQGLLVPRESNSNPDLWAQLRTAAAAVGAEETFPDQTGGGVIDDHIPFLEAGVPSIDVIDFSYEHADTTEDTPDKLDPGSLDAVGEAVAELVLALSRQPQP